MKTFLSTFSIVLLSGVLHGATVAEWNFDQDLSLAGASFADYPATDLSGNGNTMLGYDAAAGASYSALGDTPSGAGLSLDANGSQDGYVLDNGAVNGWTPLTWTVEAAVFLDAASGWRTLIGKDGSSTGASESDFYLQACGDTGEFRVLFKTVSGQRVELRSGVVPVIGQWYRLAAVSDGDNAYLYVDAGTGYVLTGSVALTGATSEDNRLANGGGSVWTFLRGWFSRRYTDHVDGRIDNIRFSDTALSPADFLSTGSKGTVIMISSVGGWLTVLSTLMLVRIKRRNVK